MTKNHIHNVSNQLLFNLLKLLDNLSHRANSQSISSIKYNILLVKTFANEPNQHLLRSNYMPSGKDRVYLLVRILLLLIDQPSQSSQMFDARKTV